MHADEGAGVERLDLDGTTHWMRPGLEPAPPAVHLLPGFDEYLLGYQDRSLPLAAEHSQRIVPGGNGIFLPLIVAKGRVIGTWRRVPGSKPGAIDPDYFTEPTAAQRAAFVRAFGSYAVFSGD